MPAGGQRELFKYDAMPGSAQLQLQEGDHYGFRPIEELHKCAGQNKTVMYNYLHACSLQEFLIQEIHVKLPMGVVTLTGKGHES